MKFRPYLVVYDRPLDFDPQSFNDLIASHRAIIDWWHYLESAYILITNKTAIEIQEDIHVRFPSLAFFVAPIGLNENAGYLLPKAWEWINARKPQYK